MDYVILITGAKAASEITLNQDDNGNTTVVVEWKDRSTSKNFFGKNGKDWSAEYDATGFMYSFVDIARGLERSLHYDGRVFEKKGKGPWKQIFSYEKDSPHTDSSDTARIDSVNCPTMRGNQALDIPPLDYVFEAGTTYYVGLEHQSSNQQQWRFVVWKVE